MDKVRDLPSGKPYHNEKSEKYVQRGFDKEYNALKEQLKEKLLEGREKDDNILLQYPDVLNVLTSLGFLPKNKALENHEVQLVQELWTLMRGHLNAGVSFDTLRTVLLNVYGLRTRDREP